MLEGPGKGKTGEEFFRIGVKTAMGAKDESLENDALIGTKSIIIPMLLIMAGVERMHGGILTH